MTISTACPSAKALRWTLERHILDLYEADGSTLKPQAQWPGYYTLPNNTRIPAVFVAGKDMVPSQWEITGIECVIDEVPGDITSPGGLVQFERWNVRFTNYGTKQGTRLSTSMLDIRRRLARAFPRDRFTYMNRTEVTYESITGSILGPVLNPPIP